MTAVLGPQQFLVVLAHIHTTRKRGWEAKHRIVSVLATYPAGNPMSVEAIALGADVSTSTAFRCCRELEAERVIVRLVDGTGSAATAWAVNPQLDQWQGVPWRRDPLAVLAVAFHVAPPERDAKPVWRRDPMNRDASGSSVAMYGIAMGNPVASRSMGPRDKLRERVATYGTAMQTGEGGLVVDLPSVGSDTQAPTDSPAPAGGSFAPWELASARRAVVAAAVGQDGRKPFLTGGRPLEQLTELLAGVGLEQLTAWLVQAPAGLGVPMLVQWLDDQRTELDPELVAQLEERERRLAEEEAAVIASGDLGATTGGGPGGEPDPPRPRLQEFTGHADDETPVDATTAVQRLREAKQRIQTTPSDSEDDRMTTSTGGPTT